MTLTFLNAITGAGINSFHTSYATARTGSGLGTGDYEGGSVEHTFDGTNYVITRWFLHFNSAGIPEGSRLISAFVRFPGTATVSSNTDTDTVHLVQSSVATDSTIATSDWTNLGTTSLGSLAFASWNTAGNNDIALTAGGLALVNPAGYTKLAARSAHDINSVQPTGQNDKSFTSGSVLLSVSFDPPGGAALFSGI